MTTPETTKQPKIQLFDSNRVRPLPGQPRKRFAGIEELAASIQEIGQISPGLVTPVSDDPNYDAQLVDGERRLRACKLAGAKFRAETIDESDPARIFALSFAANFGKQNHDPIEIAEGLQKIRESGKSLEETSKIAGRSVPWVCTYLSLLKLIPQLQQMMTSQGCDNEKPLVALSQGIELARIPLAMQAKIAEQIGPGLAVKRMRGLIRKEYKAAGFGRMQSGSRSIQKLNTLIENFCLHFDVYAELPGDDLGRMIDAAEINMRRKAVESLESLAENASGIAEAIVNRAMRHKTASSRTN